MADLKPGDIAPDVTLETPDGGALGHAEQREPHIGFRGDGLPQAGHGMTPPSVVRAVPMDGTDDRTGTQRFIGRTRS